MTKLEFLQRVSSLGNTRYNYDCLPDEFKYKDKILIRCKVHGIFEQYCYVHLRGAGCKLCGNNVISKKRESTGTYFINKCTIIHNNKYDYTNTKYIRANKLLNINCKQHGIFILLARKHLEGYGCPNCKYQELLITRKNKFIDSGCLTHNNKYKYNNVVYIDQFKKVEIECPIHGNFLQRPKDHIRGAGCSICANDIRGWKISDWTKRSKNNKGHFYIIKCWNKSESFYKFGITIQDIEDRFKYKLPYQWKCVRDIYADIETIYYKEITFRRFIKKHKYIPKLTFSGNTECFVPKFITI